MALPALVLVHGGAHASDCWDLTVDEIRRLAPELTVLAVDLPGRRGKPGDLAAVRIADCVESVIADSRRGLASVSADLLTVPAWSRNWARRECGRWSWPRHSCRRRALRYWTASAARLGWYARRAAAARKTAVVMPRIAARLAFCNDMTREQRKFVLPRICGESIHLVTEKIDRRQLPDDVPWTWILTGRDRSLSRRQQRRSIAALPGFGTVIPMDACHDMMVSEPERLAEILVGRCRRYSR